MEDKEKPEQEEKIVFTDRRVNVFVGRTLKTDANKFEFIKFGLGLEGTIGDGVNRSDAHNQMFKEMMTELILREAAIKTAHDADNIDQIVQLLKGIQRDAEQKKVEITDREDIRDPASCPSFGRGACPSGNYENPPNPDEQCKSCEVTEDPHLCPSFGTTACPSSGHKDAMDPEDGRCKTCGVMEVSNDNNISKQNAENADGAGNYR